MNLQPIPTTAGFLASATGEIFSPDGLIRNTYRNNDGYKTASVKTLDGRWVTYGVHRLVALAHLVPDPSPDLLGQLQTEVNHRDGDKSNNAASNLEWVTSSENNIHSEIFRTDNQYPTIRAAKDGERHYELLLNVHQASAATGVSVLDIWDSIRYNEGRDSGDGVRWYFWHQPWNGVVPENLKKQKVFKRWENGEVVSRAVKLLDLDTGDIVVFASMAQAARYFGVCASHIFVSIPKNGSPRLFRKRYQVAYDGDDFPEIHPEQLERMRNHGARDTAAFCPQDNLIVIAESAKDLIAQLGLSKKAVTTSLVEKKIRPISDGEKDWYVTYFTDQSSIEHLQAHAKGPASA